MVNLTEETEKISIQVIRSVYQECVPVQIKLATVTLNIGIDCTEKIVDDVFGLCNAG